MTYPSMIERVLKFWFGDGYDPTDALGLVAPQAQWFTKDANFDQMVRERFVAIYEQAAAGQLADWTETATGCLALVLVLDQFPRNMFRNSARAFATDNQALAIAQLAMDLGFDQEVSPVMRAFFYLPFEHSESLQNQNRAVQLFKPFLQMPGLEHYYDFSLKHQAVIEQFGRFPHRNSILGRSSTPAELEFLQKPGSGF